MADPRSDYLTRLDAALVGPRRTRRSLVREAADHLDDATEALVDAGYDEETAARRAVVDFGSVPDIAASFQTALAVAASRRTVWLLLLVLGYQPLLWDSGLNLASNSAGTRSDRWLFHLLDGAIEAGSWIVLAGALFLLVVTGIGNRWWFIGRATARFAGAFALAATTFVPLTSVGMIVAAGSADVGLWMLALTLVVLPLAGVAVSARRTLAAT
ncbi:permease prefix domain 1-containing protein [Streptomyces xiangluensis]|uniref:Permease prefix domain 1-containing protein n=1 Tax=Streptomyces xiangluensis TaxID=2665720 RepID=A0ABV8YIA9_9ACTN